MPRPAPFIRTCAEGSRVRRRLRMHGVGAHVTRAIVLHDAPGRKGDFRFGLYRKPLGTPYSEGTLPPCGANAMLLQAWRRRWWRPDRQALAAYAALRPMVVVT